MTSKKVHNRQRTGHLSRAKPELDEEVEDEVDFTLGLPRPYHKHRQLLQDLREAESTHIDPERFRYNIDIADARILTEPDAVLALHILEIHNISLRVTSFNINMPMFFYMMVTIGNVRRLTNIGVSDTNKRVRIDSLLHFSFKVSRYRDSVNNRMRMELWAFQDPEVHFIISTKDVHIFTFIREIHGIHSSSMWTDALRAAKVVYEFGFAYGAFGYGHSNQLKNTDCTIFEGVQNSLFPRLATNPEDNTDGFFKIYIPAKLHLLSLNSFIFEAPKKEIEGVLNTKNNLVNPLKKGRPRIFTADQVEFQNGVPVHCEVNMSIYQKEFEAEFNEIYGTFLCFTKRKERLEFLSALLSGRLEDLRESRFGSLFSDLDEGVIERIVKTDPDPRKPIYPFTHSCTVNPTAVVLAEDEPLLTKFPSLTRTTGWLGRLFGFAPREDDPHFNEPDFPIQECYVPLESKTPWYRSSESTLHWVWRMIRTGINSIYLCIFPELRRQMDVPEISVTLASPQGSTTDLYVQWFDDETESSLFKAREKVARQLEADAKKLTQEIDDSEQHEIDDFGTETLKDETAATAILETTQTGARSRTKPAKK